MRVDQKRLPRLEEEFYRGRAAVHWTFGIADRAEGWLNEKLHGRFREVLAHACARYRCASPVYCLMPDHMHILLLGMGEDSDTRLAAIFLRKHLSPALAPALLQKQAYDHVLRDAERERAAFVAACHYILENPVRAELCATASEYPFSGALAAGYPDLRVHEEKYWDLFWRIVEKHPS